MAITSKLVAATYAKPADAESVVQALGDAGFADGDISIVYTDATHVAEHGLRSGLVFGGVVGGLVGFIFPPLGLVVAAGPILGSIASAAASATVLGIASGTLSAITGALVSWGMPRNVADRFGQHIHRGDALIMVHTTDADEPRARVILDRFNPTSDAPVEPAAAAPTS